MLPLQECIWNTAAGTLFNDGSRQARNQWEVTGQLPQPYPQLSRTL